MKYFSEYTGKTYDTAEECREVEERILRAKEEQESAKQKDLEELAEMKAEMERAKEICERASKAYSESYKILSNSISKFYKAYKYVPQEYQNINFILSLLTNFEI